MPRKHRLSGEEIRNLVGKPASPAGRRFHGRFLSVLVAPIESASPKCAVVVSKKISSRAVVRNKIKRRLRNIVAKHISSLKKPVAIVLYAKPEARDAEFSELSRDIEALFLKV